MARCSFCGNELEKGTGKIVVQRDSTILNFCTRRCEKNMLVIKRNPLKVKWTLKHRAFKGKAGAEALELGKAEKAKDVKTPRFEEKGAQEEKDSRKPKEEGGSGAQA